MTAETVDAPAPEDLEVHLVPLRRRHLRSVLRIESQVYPRPWTLTLFLSELNMRSGRAYVAARVDGIVVGYAGLMMQLDEAHVTTIAVDPAWQRHKVGSRLLSWLAHSARAMGAKNLTLEVRVSNAPAQAMYRNFGFEEVGIRKNYYTDVREDALIMWANDIDTEAYAALLKSIDDAIPGRTVVHDSRNEEG
ncbi:MAG: ribosomal protein S18-alanine N-acetyltransferase, partial [Acidimicrobiaceae bacterium]|nr:ribosomal protein S18-alanine N-acetyltransferase [Acidimicrobiaceae bacterium]